MLNNKNISKSQAILYLYLNLLEIMKLDVSVANC